MSERRRSALLSMFFGYAGLAISLARNILLVPVYLHRISLAEYGAWLATGGALALILISDYGLSGVVTQRISARYGAEDFESLGGLTGSALAIGALLGLGLSVVSLCFVPFLPGLGGLDAAQSRDVASCFILAVAANALGIVGATASSVVRSLQRVVVSGWINLAAEAANVTVIVAGLYTGHGLYALAGGLLVRSAVLTLGGLLAVWFVCTRSLRTRIEIKSAAVRDLIGEASRFFLSSIALRLLAQANVFFVGMILGPASAAVYSLTVRAHDTAVMVITLVTGALVPSMTHLFGSGKIARFRVVVERVMILLSAMTAFAMTATVILNPAFLGLWVGKAGFAGEPVSILMALALFVSLVSGVAYDVLLAQGKFRFVSGVFVMSSIVQVVLLAVLLHFGLWVAPVATMVSSCVWGFAFWRTVSRDIGLSSGDVWKLVGELARLGAVSTAAASAFLALYPYPESWAGLVVEGLTCVCGLSFAYLAFSPRLRDIAQEEIGTTLRLFRSA
jgi:O-antigen/teichoic acid export membrane protein